NFGTITGTTNQGISAGADSTGTINNNVGASIIGGATAVTGQGLSVININNAGLIRGLGLGIDAATVNVSSNSDTIDATGTDGRAISGFSGTIANSVGGTIQANGLRGIAVQVDTAIVVNSGTIQANGVNGRALSGTDINLVNS